MGICNSMNKEMGGGGGEGGGCICAFGIGMLDEWECWIEPVIHYHFSLYN